MENNRTRTSFETVAMSEPVSIMPDRQGKFSEMLWLLWRSRAFLFRVFILTAIVSAIVSLIIPAKYMSTARVVPSETSGSSSILASLLSHGAGNAGGSFGLDAASLLGVKTPEAFYVDVLHSETLQNAMINKFDLRTHYRKKYYEDARKKLTKNTGIDEDKKSGVITISVIDVDRKLAADMVHEYIAQMNRLSEQLNTSAAHREREFLEQRLASAKQDLDQSLLQLSEFSSKYSMMDQQNQGKSMMEAVAKLQGELIAKESELKGLEQIYAEDSPRVRSLRASIAELRAKLKDLVGDYTEPSSADTSNSNSALYPSIRKLPALGYRYQDLYRKSKINEAVYEYLRQQYELARIQEARELPVVRVMDPGSVAEKKTSPIRSLIVGVSVLFGMIFACAWVIQKNKWDQLPEDHSNRLLASEIADHWKRSWKKFLKPSLRRN